ncbi:MAG: SRPBCC domain-containing protein [Sporocytophaga sp.]|uniref:SRPBCC family protein n=1 Tax=Sporocytophaga sp. TaxID=2231183 RepID=UPI001B138FE4|nr:SRPBCC domain-containing protein [Sporocytophaga sp.]MBO9702903.1 SRPBCC domain-containing protein [Sporocytophaga sp.]
MEERNKATTDREVYLTYTFNAPREMVFKAWTDPKQLVKWFAPHNCTISYKQLDIRKGGTYLSCINNPQYGDCWCKGVYKEVIFPELIEFTMVVSDEHGNTVDPVRAGMDPDWPIETLVSIAFSEHDGKTTIVLRQTVSQQLATKTGAYPSWIQMLERLETEL